MDEGNTIGEIWKNDVIRVNPIPSLALHIQFEKQRDPFINHMQWWNKYSKINNFWGKIMAKVHHPKTRRFQLYVDTIETLDDVKKKILDVMNIKIQTDHPRWDEVEDYFCTEAVPKGYLKLLKIGFEGIAKLHYHEMEQQCNELLKEEDEKTN